MVQQLNLEIMHVSEVKIHIFFFSFYDHLFKVNAFY